MINNQRRRLINYMIQRAVTEEIDHYIAEHLGQQVSPLREARFEIARNAGDRITGDIGRERRMTQLFAQKKVK